MAIQTDSPGCRRRLRPDASPGHTTTTLSCCIPTSPNSSTKLWPQSPWQYLPHPSTRLLCHLSSPSLPLQPRGAMSVPSTNQEQFYSSLVEMISSKAGFCALCPLGLLSCNFLLVTTPPCLLTHFRSALLSFIFPIPKHCSFPVPQLTCMPPLHTNLWPQKLAIKIVYRFEEINLPHFKENLR